MKYTTITERRQVERISTSISAVVKGKQDQGIFWKETTQLISMSRSGAGFYLDQKCEIGRLISLMSPMPRHLRSYDQERELYRVWGLVQHCSQRTDNDGAVGYHVGVAFIGKNPPSSYNKNPLQSYRIAGMNADGTWRIIEAQRDFVIRRHPRQWINLTVKLSAHDEQENLLTDENAKTENISQGGAAVFTDLKLGVGDSVNFECLDYDFSATAVVRYCNETDYKMPRLHLEFIDADFPVQKIWLPQEKDILDESEISEED